MAIGEVSNNATPAVAGDNTGTTGGPFGHHPKQDSAGVFGHSNVGYGVVGITAARGAFSGVYGEGGATGVTGQSENGQGVAGYGTGPNGIGVFGQGGENNPAIYGNTISATQPGVWGQNNGRGPGVVGKSNNDVGVKGEGNVGVIGIGGGWIGVYGETSAPASVGSAGVWGDGKDSGDGVKGVAKGPKKAAVCGFHLTNQGPGIFGQGAPAGRFEGDVEVTGDIRLLNADCAEEFDIAGVEAIEPGTVMVLGEEGDLKPSDHAYDKRVAGVISGAGGYKPGIVLDKQPTQRSRLPVALLGKVFCKVDAGPAPVEVGDLLTTSDTPGHAMKAGDASKAFGSVIGKALRPLKTGRGLIPILIALQ
jgi:hypothetical protein